MDNVINKFSLKTLKELSYFDEFISIDNDFIIARLTNYDLFQRPSKIEGFIAVFCLAGNAKCVINFNEYTISDGSLLLIIPDNIVSLSPLNETDKHISLLFIALSPKYMTSLCIGAGKVFGDAIKFLKKPCIKLSQEEIEIANQYLQLINKIIATDTIYKKECIGNLITSYIHLCGSFVKQNIMDDNNIAGPSISSRHQILFDQFISLVKQHHIHEHSVIFYADKLCITPKYLSKIIKHVCNMSAPEIIDKYVFLEAEYMLKYSEFTIKEISDSLSFSSQQSFSKYFKSHTGYTPKKYREK